MRLCCNIKRKHIPINQQSSEGKRQYGRIGGEQEPVLSSAKLAAEGSSDTRASKPWPCILKKALWSDSLRRKNKRKKWGVSAQRTRFCHAKSVDLGVYQPVFVRLVPSSLKPALSAAATSACAKLPLAKMEPSEELPTLDL